MREDAHTLYGFLKLSDRDLFRTLLKVNGVGARLALAILSGMETPRFISCIQEGDAAVNRLAEVVGWHIGSHPDRNARRPVRD